MRYGTVLVPRHSSAKSVITVDNAARIAQKREKNDGLHSWRTGLIAPTDPVGLRLAVYTGIVHGRSVDFRTLWRLALVPGMRRCWAQSSIESKIQRLPKDPQSSGAAKSGSVTGVVLKINLGVPVSTQSFRVLTS